MFASTPRHSRMNSIKSKNKNNNTRMGISSAAWLGSLLLAVSTIGSCHAFVASPPMYSSFSFRHTATRTTTPTSVGVVLHARPERLEDNIDGPLFVNSKCINCAACAMFAPTVFSRRPTDGAHIVHHQPEIGSDEIDQARAALAACPVAAIRVETKADRHHRGLEPPSEQDEALIPQLAINPKFNGLSLPFPRPITTTKEKDDDDADDDKHGRVYYIGHHNEKSFGACPYLFSCTTSTTTTTTNNNKNKSDNKVWIMVDTPKFSKSAVATVESLTGQEGRGPDFLFLTHVDDTADHNKWKEHYPDLKRIFHQGDLGRHNWLGDETLNDVEILLQGTTQDDISTPLQFFTLDGKPLTSLEDAPAEKEDVLLIHTPGHSPGSISLWKRPSLQSPDGVLFTGDTYAYTTRNGGYMTGFPRYGNNRQQQARILPRLLDLDWEIIAPGHGHVREYSSSRSSSTTTTTTDAKSAIRTTTTVSREEEMQAAIQELQRY